MASKLDLEARMTIRKLTERGLPNTEIAGILGVTEGAVRYHQRRQSAGTADGRARQRPKAADHREAILAWLSARRGQRGALNLADLHTWLVVEHGYDGSLRSVERYFRKIFPRPRRRAQRRFESPLLRCVTNDSARCPLGVSALSAGRVSSLGLRPRPQGFVRHCSGADVA
jgi:transposase